MKRYMIRDIMEMIGEVLLWAIGILAALLIIVLLGILIYGLLFDPSMFCPPCCSDCSLEDIWSFIQ